MRQLEHELDDLTDAIFKYVEIVEKHHGKFTTYSYLPDIVPGVEFPPHFLVPCKEVLKFQREIDDAGKRLDRYLYENDD